MLCWLEKPPLNFEFRRFMRRVAQTTGVMKKMFYIALYIVGITAVLTQQVLYFASLPAAVLNEWVRNW